MAQRDVNIAIIAGYLVVFWGAVAGLFVFVTGNSAPGAPKLAWGEAEAVTTTKLEVEIATEAPDADGDESSYTYAWTRNGEPTDFKGKSISAKETLSGETWEVTVTPDDGTKDGWGCNLPWRECAGEINAKLSITVNNSPPRARIVFRAGEIDEETGERPEVEEFAKKGEDVYLELSCFDADVNDRERRAREEALAKGETFEKAPEGEEPPDPCTYTVNWWPVGEDFEEPEEGATSEYTEPMLGKNDIKKADTWKVVVVANDAEADGDAVESTIARALE